MSDARTVLCTLFYLVVVATHALAEPDTELPLRRRPGTEDLSNPSVLESNELPFNISSEKRLEDELLEEKKEGWVTTGLPQLSADPVNGFGVGFDGFLYSNGDRSDPFFEYTPYRTKLELHAVITNKGQKEFSFESDAPYVFDSKWRMRVELGYEDNPNVLYFGKTAATMGPLSYRGQTKSTYDDYSNALDTIRAGGAGEAPKVTDLLFNTFRIQEAKVSVRFERSFLEGKMRAVGGLEIGNTHISTFDGTDSGARDPVTGQVRTVPNGLSLLTLDQSNNGLIGIGYNFITQAQFGIVYDSRDFEPDAGRGVLVELTDELSTQFLGSNYNFNKIFLQGQYFTQMLPEAFDRLVFAGRAALQYTDGNAPFFEYEDGFGTEGTIEGLGGLRTLRGYKESRFLARWMAYLNAEFRCRITDFHFLGSHFALTAVPFLDLGRVWDRFSDLGLDGFRADGGAGVRIAWDQATIIMLDYAVSGEDHQFFLNYGNIF